MGQKVHPTGIRLGVVKDHNSVWYADSKTYAQNLINDLEVREYILKKLDAASVSRVKIERPRTNSTHHHLHCAPRHCDWEEG